MDDRISVKIRSEIAMRNLDELKPAHRNARTHSRKQLRQIADSIERFGFTNPVLVDHDDRILAGHGRVAAARLLEMRQIPVLCVGDLSPEDRRAYALADNKIVLNAGWDQELLALELQLLIDIEFDVELTGFSLAEIDFTLDAARDASPDERDEPLDRIPAIGSLPITQAGDLWHLGRHQLLCGDARDEAAFARLLGDERANLVFTDPPYNVKIDGHVSGLGAVKHREFAFASGEMSEAEFTRFLVETLGNAAGVMRDGAIAFVCMDWRHMTELLAAGQRMTRPDNEIAAFVRYNSGREVPQALPDIGDEEGKIGACSRANLEIPTFAFGVVGGSIAERARIHGGTADDNCRRIWKSLDCGCD